jgi:PKD repeat protein
MPQRSLWKLLVISFFAFLVVACKPIASFSVSPDPVQAGVEATFDASSTIIYNKPKNNAAKSYAWDFGDGSTGSGKVVTHTYAAAGTFKVKLTVIDTAGRKGETMESLVVTSGDEVNPTTTTLKVITQIAGGVSLPGAEVTVGTATATSNADGLATLDAAPVGEDQVVTVKKEGYLTQSVRATLLAGDEPNRVLVLLMPEKDTLSITDIAAAQTLTSNYLGASVTVPANAFVIASTGAPATGPATLKLTPWDIRGIDLQAMPGNGLALDASGNLVDLISAGMMSVEFFDAAGNKLQVAADKTATIQMDLPAGTTGIGGNPIGAGTSIPLWHFDEVRGLWIGEGTGTVVATPSGLAVTGTVSHFSIWNWDYVTATPIVSSGSSGGGSAPPPDATKLTLSCLDPDGVLTACRVQAVITYPDGSIRSWSTYLTAAETTIANIPGNPTMEWTATTDDGLTGTATSGTTGNVAIQLDPPNVNNFVRCAAPSGAAACTVTRTAPISDGSINTVTSYIPAEGANIRAQLDTAGPLTWTASTGFAASANDTWTRYNGTASSGISGDVIINLEAEVVSTGKSIQVSCLPDALNEVGAAVTLSTCEIRVNVFDASGAFVTNFYVPNGLDGPVSVVLPDLGDSARIDIYANGISEGILREFETRPTFSFGELSNNQSIQLELTWRPFDPA